MNDEAIPSVIGPRKRRVSSRDRWLLGGLAVLGAVVILFWRPLERRWLTYLLLRAAAPSSEVLTKTVEQTGKPEALLWRLWQSQHIPQQHFVLSYLGGAVSRRRDLVRALEPLVVEATRDVDLKTRELAFAVLARSRSPQFRLLALEQLADADPAARILGLQQLRRVATSNDVSAVMGLLDDADPRVAVAAGLVLRTATGQDFGLRSTQALPWFTWIGTNAPAASNWEAIRQGVQKWRQWWAVHRAEYPAPPQLNRRAIPAKTIVAGDFKLDDVEGKAVHLTDYRGKVVLLAFWGPNIPGSLADVAALNALRQRHAEEAVVLGICLSDAEHDHEHEHGSESMHAHHHEASFSPAPPSAPARAFVQQIGSERQIQYPLLLDQTGKIGLRFDVEELPTYVLIDTQGLIRRRFAGNRSQQVLEAMIAEAADTGTRLSRP